MDTAGQEDLAEIRRLAYPQTSCFVLCFSVTEKPSFDNLTQGEAGQFGKWIEELRNGEPNAKILLTGTKKDLRGQGSKGTGTMRNKEVQCFSFRPDNIFTTAFMLNG